MLSAFPGGTVDDEESLMTQRSGLVTKFAFASLIPILLLGLVLGRAVRGFLHQRSLTNAQQAAELAAEIGVKPQLSPSDLIAGVSPERVAALDQVLRSPSVQRSIAAIRVWNRDRKVVYADDRSLLGYVARPGQDEELDEALEGREQSEIAAHNKPELPRLSGVTDWLEVYVPLRFEPDQSPTGAFEIYLSYDTIADAIDHDTTRVYLLLAGGLLLLYLMLFRLVLGAARRLRKQAEENRYQALHDQLTGLPNRQLFQDRVNQAILNGKRDGGSSSVILIDLDRFKEVNDTLGHRNGDQLLKQVAQRMRGTLREIDTISRWGGDEFAILLPDSSETGAVQAANRLLEALETPFTLQGVTFRVEASAGIVLFPEHGEDVDLLLQRADVAMYVAKEAHSGFDVYSPDQDTYSPDRLALIAELKQAIDERELALCYQPQVDIRSGAVTGVEALLRWHHPQRGVLLPDEFIPLAEHTGLIVPLTYHVLEEALHQCHLWDEAGLHLRVGINVSARSLLDEQFPMHAARLFEKWSVEPEQVELEMTETAVMANPGRSLVILDVLSDLGVSIALDDFGTGYSSLAYLQRLPVTKLKIDKSFIVDMTDDDNDCVIVQSTIALGQNLGLQVVAEGVETKETWNRLAAMGCECAQGYYLTLPVPGDELVGWMGSWEERRPAAAAAHPGA
jgi:diguanylate cyclase (GGDEF)-like protein